MALFPPTTVVGGRAVVDGRVVVGGGAVVGGRAVGGRAVVGGRLDGGGGRWARLAGAMRWAGVAVVVGVGLVGCGAVAPGRAVRAAVPGRPVLAPGPVPLVRTVDVTVTRTSPSDAAQSIRVHPDGVWQFTPAQGSALAMVVNGGRLDPATHARLAVLLAAPALRAEAALPDEPCPAGYRYSVVAGPTTAAWTQCGASQRPTLSAVLALVEAAEPKF